MEEKDLNKALKVAGLQCNFNLCKHSHFLAILDDESKPFQDNHIIGNLDLGKAFVAKANQPKDLVPLEVTDQHYLRDKATAYYNLTRVGCILPNASYCSAQFLYRVMNGTKLGKVNNLFQLTV